jgi:hypothetical protein
MKNKKLYLVAFFLILIAYNKFFEFRLLEDFSNKLVIVVFMILLAFTFRRLSYKKGLFIGSIKCIIFSLFIAVISSVLFWNQDLLQSFVAIAPFSYFLLFLFLIEAKINRDLIIKIILAFAYIGLILFSYQFFFTKTVLFGGWDEFNEDRGTLRILFPGEGFMFFALFYYLNKLGKKFKIKYLIALIPFLLMMLMQVTRIYILAFGLIAIYHFMVRSKVQYRVYGIIVFLACYLFYYNTDNKIVKGVRDATENDIGKKEDYIRLIAADYYLFEFSNNNATYFFGNGAYNYKSSYGKKLLSLNENEHYYLDDLGLLKGYILFGILFVTGYILIFIKSFTIKIPYNQLYLKYYIWMILILSLTTRANTNAGFGVVLVTVLYLFEFAYLEQNNLLKAKNKVGLKRDR